jgi:hypothetical protein
MRPSNHRAPVFTALTCNAMSWSLCVDCKHAVLRNSDRTTGPLTLFKALCAKVGSASRRECQCAKSACCPCYAAYRLRHVPGGRSSVHDSNCKCPSASRMRSYTSVTGAALPASGAGELLSTGFDPLSGGKLNGSLTPSLPISHAPIRLPRYPLSQMSAPTHG